MTRCDRTCPLSLLLLLALLTATTGFAQNIPDTVWSTPLNTPDGEFLTYDIAPLEDGSTLLYGSTWIQDQGDDSQYQLGLIRLDEDGIITATSELETLWNTIPRFMVALSPSEVFTSYISDGDDGYALGDRVIRRYEDTDDGWESVWSDNGPNLPAQTAVHLTGIALADDGVHPPTLVTGWAHQQNTTLNLAILRYDLDGTLIAEHAFPDLDPVVQFSDLLIHPDGQVDMLLQMPFEGQEFRPYRIVRVNEDGAIVSNQEYFFPDDGYYNRLQLTRTRNGGMVVTGRNDDVEQGIVVYHDADGTQRWSTFTNREFITGVLELSDGNLLALTCDIIDSPEFACPATWALLDRLTGNTIQEEALPWSSFSMSQTAQWEDGPYMITGDADAGDGSSQSIAVKLVDAVDGVAPAVSRTLPNRFSLHPVAPNPFNGSTTITLDLPLQSPLALGVYDLLGRPVRVLHDGPAVPGTHRFTFDGHGLASGTYLLRAETEDEMQVRRMLFLK